MCISALSRIVYVLVWFYWKLFWGSATTEIANLKSFRQKEKVQWIGRYSCFLGWVAFSECAPVQVVLLPCNWPAMDPPRAIYVQGLAMLSSHR